MCGLYEVRYLICGLYNARRLIQEERCVETVRMGVFLNVLVLL